MLAAFLNHQLQHLCLLPNIELQPNHHLTKLQITTNKENTGRQMHLLTPGYHQAQVPENTIDSYSLLPTPPGC